jgi:hypothetical protein
MLAWGPPLYRSDMLKPEPADSSTRIVREAARALSGAGRGILEVYPPGSILFLGLVRLLPESWRIAAIEWGISQSLGRSPAEIDALKPDSLPNWCVAQYPRRRWPAIIVGAPNGAVAHLAGLLRAPFLTSSFLLGFRHRIPPDHIRGYYRFGADLARPLLQASADFEAINHYDPLHDRSLVKYADLLRLRLIKLPQAYRDYIVANLARGGRLILIECTYPWPQYQIAQRSFLQVGGLGGVSPEQFLEQWNLNLPLGERPESEWGCPSELADDLRQLAQEKGFHLVQLRFDHPQWYSLLAYRAYLAAGALEAEVMLDCFTYISPYTNITTGIPALWLPFNTVDSLEFARSFLQRQEFNRIYLALVPSFARCGDTAPFPKWLELLRDKGPVELLGIDPGSYPVDPLAPFAYSTKLARIRRRCAPRPRLKLQPEALEGLTEELGTR